MEYTVTHGFFTVVYTFFVSKFCVHSIFLLIYRFTMKNKFATIDLFAVLHDLQPFVNMRVTNVYDIDSRTYLLKLQR